MKTFGVIMAGGGGTRFWPLSRKNLPKQLLNLSGNEIMVNETIDRLKNITEQEDIFVVTNITQAELMLIKTKGRLLKNHILAEPAARNTAACIGYSAMEILKKYGDGIMCILPSDHFIKDIEAYQRILKKAVKTAGEKNCLVTIGIQPSFPATGYGYIKYQKNALEEFFKVEEFVEKPDEDIAKSYIAEGNYLWNSGMFVWKASVILEEFQKLLPDIYEYLEEIGESMGTEKEKETIHRVYPQIPKISIDYGIMERAKNVAVIPGDFGWNDVGSFDALESVYNADENGNVVHGEYIQIDSKNCVVYANDKLVTSIGVSDLVIAETQDAVLVCPKKDAQRVKEIVELLEMQQKNKYL